MEMVKLPRRGIATQRFDEEDWIKGIPVSEEDVQFIESVDEDLASKKEGSSSFLVLESEVDRNALSEVDVALFRNVCHAVAMELPWQRSGLYNSDQRKVTLKHVYDTFVEKHGGSRAVQRELSQIKNGILADVNASLLEVQAQLSVFCNRHDVWRKADSYRTLGKSGFLRKEEYRAFVDDTESRAQSRLHELTDKLSKREKEVHDAIDLWNTLHGMEHPCFGGVLTVLVQGATIPNIKPRKIYATVEIKVGQQLFGEVDVRKGAKRTSEDSNDFLFNPPQFAGLNVGAHLPVKATSVIIRFKQAEMCFFRYRTLAEFEVPLLNLYTNIDPFDDESRDKMKGAGVHHCSLCFPDDTGLNSVKVTLMLSCTDMDHNVSPPRVDVNVLQEEVATATKRCDERVNAAESIWRIDHHAEIVKLLNYFGTLQNEDYLALELYCDRFFIHNELFFIVTNYIACLRGDWSDAEDRYFARVASKELKQLRPKVMTEIGGALIDECLNVLKEMLKEKMCVVETVVKSPVDGASLFQDMVGALEEVSIATKDIPTVVSVKCEERAKRRMRKIEQLTRLFPASNEHTTSHLSVLNELGSNRSHEGKSALLYRVVQEIYGEIMRAFQFSAEAKHKGIEAIVLMKTEIYLKQLHRPLKKIVDTIITQLAMSQTPVNPLGEIVSIIATIYRETMGLVKILSAFERLYDLCDSMVQIFDQFLPTWIGLSKRQVFFWCDTCVSINSLEPQQSGKVFFCPASSDAIQMFEELHDFFAECARCGDPSIEATCVNSFCGLFLGFVEHFVEALIQKGMEEKTTIENWLVCYSSLNRFQKQVRAFWRQRIFEGLLADSGATYDVEMKRAECSVIREQSNELFHTKMDEFLTFMYRRIADENTKLLAIGAMQEKKMNKEQYLSALRNEFTSQLQVIVGNIESKLALEDILPKAMQALHKAFDRRTVQLGAKPITEIEKKFTNDVLEVVESLCTTFGDQQRVSHSVYFDFSRCSRQLVYLSTLSSKELIDKLKQTNKTLAESTLTRGETQWYLMILKERSDKEAKSFVKDLESGKLSKT